MPLVASLTANSDQDAKMLGKLRAYAFWMQKHWKTALGMKQAFEDGDESFAAQLWFELSNEERQGGIWLAPTDGGLLTTAQRDTIKSSEFRALYFGE